MAPADIVAVVAMLKKPGTGNRYHGLETGRHTARYIPCEGDVIALNIQVSDSNYLDEKGMVLAIENWKTMLQRLLDYAESTGIKPVDITGFAA
jgi:hypothetical protein